MSPVVEPQPRLSRQEAYKLVCQMENSLRVVNVLAHTLSMLAMFMERDSEEPDDCIAVIHAADEIRRHRDLIEEQRGRLFHGLHPSHDQQNPHEASG